MINLGKRVKTPDSSQSTSEKQEFAKVSVEPTAAGASFDVDGICEDDPMCMLIETLHSSQAAKNGSQNLSLSCTDGSPRRGGNSEKQTARTPERGDPADLVGGQLRVPQWHDHQRDQSPAGRLRPFLDLEVVVGLDAGQRDVLVLGLVERLAAEARERREAQRGLDPVLVHVGEPLGDAPRALAHLVVVDQSQVDVVAVVADRSVEAHQRPAQILVHPPGDVGSAARARPSSTVSRPP